MVAVPLPQRRMLRRLPCHMPRPRCRTWRRQLHRTWPLQRRIWRRRRRTWPRLISPHLRTPWPRRTADHALPPRMRHLTPSPTTLLVMRRPTLRPGEANRTAEPRPRRVSNASAPSTAQRAELRPRRTRSSTAGPTRRLRPPRNNGLRRMVVNMRPLDKLLPAPDKTNELASRGTGATCHALSNASPSSAGRRSFEIRCSRARRRQGGGRRELCRNRRSAATSRSRTCTIVAITTITI